MELRINGGNQLTGEVKIGGAKNAAVALIPAALLSDEESVIYNVPNISDIDNLIEILNYLECEVKYENETMYINPKNMKNKPIPEELTTKLRASYYFMGALLSKFNKIEISMPGGCVIGKRPIDIHLFGFQKLGVKVYPEENKYTLKREELIGNKIYFDFASVGATINVMFAAVKAKGMTVIENAAKEPEIVNIASFLINMGAKIKGAGTNQIIIEGQEKLKNGVVEVLPDRIEAATYLIIGSLLGTIVVKGAIKDHMNAFLIRLKEIGVDFKIDCDEITVYKAQRLKQAKLKTLIYPGFPTDLQQPITTLLTQADGKSEINETIYENRYNHAEELNKMGANINLENNKLIIKGPTKLRGTKVEAKDLRGAASLLIAGLIADGETIIENPDYILRGYENLIEKLIKLGAKIELI